MKIYSCNICGLAYDGPLVEPGGGCLQLSNVIGGNTEIVSYDLCFDCANELEATMRERIINHEQYNK